jgi:hypothetical protein
MRKNIIVFIVFVSLQVAGSGVRLCGRSVQRDEEYEVKTFSRESEESVKGNGYKWTR